MESIRVKSIYTRSGIPGVEWAVNPYVGCTFGCPYCYAKFMCRFHGGTWGNFVKAKSNAPVLADKSVEGTVLLSSACDPYQPAEQEAQLTRQILQNMPKSNRVEILTKSPLVTRDIDVFRRFDDIRVGVTINGLPRELEPHSPPRLLRLQALHRLHEAGIPTYAFISPVIPTAYDVAEVVEETDFVDFHFIELLNSRAAGPRFLEQVRSRYPDALDVLKDEEKRRRFMQSLPNGPDSRVIVH